MPRMAFRAVTFRETRLDTVRRLNADELRIESDVCRLRNGIQPNSGMPSRPMIHALYWRRHQSGLVLETLRNWLARTVIWRHRMAPSKRHSLITSTRLTSIRTRRG